MKRLLIFCLTVFFCLAFSGCYLDDFTASEQDKLLDDSIKIFKEYLAKTHPDAKIKKISHVTYLGENHKMQLTEFAEGEYEIDGKKLKFAVDTKSGAIYTSEQTDPFKQKMTALINEMLGLQWTAVRPDVYVTSRITLHGKKTPMGSNIGELRGVLPVNIGDMDAFVRDSFKNNDLSLSLHFIYTGAPLRPKAVLETAAKTFTGYVSLQLQRFPDTLRNDVEAASHAAWGANPQWPLNGHDSLAEESMTVKGNAGYTYQQWRDYNGKAPFTIHYPALTLTCEKQQDGSLKEEKSTFNIETELQIKQNGKQFEFVTKDNRKIKYYVFMDSLAPADNVKEIAARNRKFHDAAFNEYGWHPVLGRWCIGQKIYKTGTSNQLYAMEENDLIIIGSEGLDKLRPKKKEPEKK